MKTDRITIRVPIKPYLKSFVLSYYNSQEPILFPKRGKINFIIRNLLKKQPEKRCFTDNVGINLEIILPYYEDLNIMSYNYINPEDEKVLNEWLEMIFWTKFDEFIDTEYLQGIRQNVSISAFLEKYNIQESIEDMLKKRIYRSRLTCRKTPKRYYKKKTKSPG